MTVTDIVPVQPGDYRGLTGFYLVVGWSLGGYLVAALLGITSGARPATTRRALNRLIAFGSYGSSPDWPAPSWSARSSARSPAT